MGTLIDGVFLVLSFSLCISLLIWGHQSKYRKRPILLRVGLFAGGCLTGYMASKIFGYYGAADLPIRLLATLLLGYGFAFTAPERINRALQK